MPLNVSEDKINSLSMDWDPFPALKLINSQPADGGMGLKMPQPGAQPAGTGLQTNPYSAMLMGGPTQQQPQAQGAAPLDPRTLALINSLVPTPPKPQFIGAPGFQRPGAISTTPLATTPATTTRGPGLADILKRTA
jgi:hypothetical protein